MDSVLFRAKRLDNGEWAKGYYCKLGGKINPEIGYILCKAASILFEKDGTMQIGGFVEVDPTTAGQYTGQVDYETEAKIFCGDILEAQSGPYGKFVVDFGDGGYFIREIGGTGAGLPLSVENIAWLMLVKIGNLHDNPELMEDTDDG